MKSRTGRVRWVTTPCLLAAAISLVWIAGAPWGQSARAGAEPPPPQADSEPVLLGLDASLFAIAGLTPSEVENAISAWPSTACGRIPDTRNAVHAAQESLGEAGRDGAPTARAVRRETRSAQLDYAIAEFRQAQKDRLLLAFQSAGATARGGLADLWDADIIEGEPSLTAAIPLGYSHTQLRRALVQEQRAIRLGQDVPQSAADLLGKARSEPAVQQAHARIASHREAIQSRLQQAMAR